MRDIVKRDGKSGDRRIFGKVFRYSGVFYHVKFLTASVFLACGDRSVSSVSTPELLAELEKRGIKYLVATGVFTDGCVLATVVGGFSKGYNFVVLRDLVETSESETRQRIQKDLLNFTSPYLFACVVTSKELLLRVGISNI